MKWFIKVRTFYLEPSASERQMVRRQVDKMLEPLNCRSAQGEYTTPALEGGSALADAETKLPKGKMPGLPKYRWFVPRGSAFFSESPRLGSFLSKLSLSYASAAIPRIESREGKCHFHSFTLQCERNRPLWLGLEPGDCIME